MPQPAPNPRGLYCPQCRGVRLVVLSSRRLPAGVKVRYRECSVCGSHLKTREIVVAVTSRKPPPGR